MMSSCSPKAVADSLILQSRLSELNQVPAWIERLASLYAIPDRTQYAIDLCLEEVLSNIIRHGYKSEEGGVITVSCLSHEDECITLIVEDEAPAFNPLAFQRSPLSQSSGEISVGGQGIHLVKEFADALDYEPSPAGNRLTISFFSPKSSAASV